VRARLVARAQDWPWSSVGAHLAGQDDDLVMVAPILSRVRDFTALVAAHPEDEHAFAGVRAAEGTGRPLGNAQFIEGLERILGRPIGRRALSVFRRPFRRRS
jgi:putative transposase